MKALRLLILVLVTACSGGSDGPTTPPPVNTAPATVRGESPTWQEFAAGTMSFSARNTGGAGQWRWTAWEDLSLCNETPNCTRQLRSQCSGAATLIGAGATQPIQISCQTFDGFRWIVIETQDPSSAAWVRTACLPRPGNSCPAQLQPER